MKKSATVSIVVIGALAFSASGFIAAQFLKTPEQQLAEAEAPPPSTITVDVEEGVLTDSVSLWCSAGYVDEQVLSLVGSVSAETNDSAEASGVSGPPSSVFNVTPAIDVTQTGDGESPEGTLSEVDSDMQEPFRQIVTESPLSVGDVISPGDLVLAINDDPVFAYTGPIPLFRDLTLGASGSDVDSFQSFLRSAGVLTDEGLTGVVDSATVAAVATLYSSHGFLPNTGEGGQNVPAAAFLSVHDRHSAVLSIPPAVGSVVESELFSVGVGSEGLECAASSAQVPPSIEVGQQVLTSANTEEDELVVKKITQGSQDPEGQGDNIMGTVFVETPDGIDLPGNGQVEARVIVAETPQSYPLVPASALWTLGDDTVVSVMAGAVAHQVPVRVVLSADGLTAVEVVDKKDSLSAGDRVVVS